jgi:2'-5' RNA ligase
VRVFAALPLPASALRALDSVLTPLRRAHPRLRWVSQGSYHITLHFFGEIGEEAVSRLKALFAGSELRAPQIAAGFGPLGRFPERGAPRVIHVPLAQGADEARAYFERFHAVIAKLGYRPEARGFTPHITLARFPREPLAGGGEPDAAAPREGFLIEQCVLYQSTLGPGGPRYVALAAAAFGSPAARESAL